MPLVSQAVTQLDQEYTRRFNGDSNEQWEAGNPDAGDAGNKKRQMAVPRCAAETKLISEILKLGNVYNFLTNMGGDIDEVMRDIGNVATTTNTTTNTATNEPQYHRELAKQLYNLK